MVWSPGFGPLTFDDLDVGSWTLRSTLLPFVSLIGLAIACTCSSVLGFVFWVLGSGFGVQGLEFRVCHRLNLFMVEDRE